MTDVGAPALVRAPSVKIERGAVLAGRYQVEASIGKGGSGIVLRAFDRMTQVPVAIKILNPDLARDPKWLERFSRELRLARQIQHPHVCRVFDIGESDGHWFLTMELAGAGTLRDSLLASEFPRRSLENKIADARAAIAGLAAIHGAQIIHRDIKPENFLRMEDGRLVLSDFGLAAVRTDSTNVTIMVGTPSYMAPEVVMGEPATARSDVWSLGVVLHEIFFGRRPEWEPKRRGNRPLRPPWEGVASRIEKAAFSLCQLCVGDDPQDRPLDASEVLSWFAPVQRGSSLKPGGRFGRRRTARFIGLGFVAAAVALLAVNRQSLWSRAEATRSNPRPAEVVPRGAAIDWSRLGKPIALLDGRIHCLSTIKGGRAARVIWGSPRRAADFDLESGARDPAPLSPNTFATGCPQLSPGGDALLFTAEDESGVAQIRLSNRNGNGPSKVITTGYEPLWMANGQEFLYSIDSAHSAVFSLPTKTFTLLADSDPEGAQARGIVDKAVSARGDEISLLRLDDHADRFLSIYSNPGLRLLRTLRMTPARKIDFDPLTNRMLVSCQNAATPSSVIDLNWQTAEARNVGFFPGFEVAATRAPDGRHLVVATREADDVWLYDGASKRQLTDDGENVSASMSADGELLIGKRSADGKYAIWAYDRNGSGRQATSGPRDVGPEFSPSGTEWVYVDYDRTSMMLCDARTNACKEIRKDTMLPEWPTFSPDGMSIGYLTQLNTPRLMIVSREGVARDLGPALPDCPPVWSTKTRLWAHEKSERRSFWAEREVITGARTGKELDFPAGVEPGRCWWPDASPGSPFFRRIRIERRDSSRLVSASP